MLHPRRLASRLTLPLISLVMLSACGGNPSVMPPPAPAPVTVAITPTTAALITGATQQFTASVTGAGNTAVTWTVQETGGGTITPAGVYTAPATGGTYHVVATSVADITKSATATVTVTVPVAVTVTPTAEALITGATQQFTATVTGASNTTVNWTVQETGGGTITAAGFYTAPAMPGTYHVVATSTADATKSATSTVTVTAPVAVTLAPATTSVLLGNSITFIATVTGTSNQGVTWSAGGVPGGNAQIGKISSAGVYTAPADLPPNTSLVITATSTADATKSATAMAQITSDLKVIIVSAPSGATSVGVNSPLHLAATVTSAGQPDHAVQWFVNGVSGGNASTGTVAGALDGTAVYTAPTAIPSPAQVTLTATSVADPTQAATLAFTVTGPVVVAVSPSTATVAPLATQQFTVDVSGAQNQAVAWSVNGIVGGSAAVGTISSAGLFTAPTNPPVAFTVTVAATSVQFATALGTASATLTGTIESATATISASSGGTISLPSGSQMTIPAGVLDADTIVTVALQSGLNQPAIPNANFLNAGPVLYVTFTPVGTTTRGTRPGDFAGVSWKGIGGAVVSFTVTVGRDVGSLAKESLGVIKVTGDAGDAVLGAVVEVGHLAGTAIVDLTVNDVNALTTGVRSVTVGFARAINFIAEPTQETLLLWDPTSATFIPPPNEFTPKGRTVILLHGIFSSVESAFGPCVQALIAAGSYQTVVGIDYNYLYGTSANGQRAAAIINQLAGSMLVNHDRGPIDIEAHSMGALVTLAALLGTTIPARTIIRHVSLIGGVIEGTPVAGPGHYLPTYLLTRITPDVAQFYRDESFGDLVGSPGLTDLNLKSNASTSILAALGSQTHVIPNTMIGVAEGTATTDITPTAAAYFAKQLFPGQAFDSFVGIDSASARNSGLTVTDLGPYNVSHTHLECGSPDLSVAIGRFVSTPITVLVDPPSANLGPGGTRHLTATVGGTPNLAVTWSLPAGSNSGTLSNATSVAVDYTAPTTPGVYTVTALSVADDTISGTAALTVTTPGAISVSVAPAQSSLRTGSSETLTVSVAGTTDASVTWAVREGASGGTIATGASSSQVTYTAPATTGTFHVVATSVADPTASAVAAINVASGGSFVPTGSMMVGRINHTATLLKDGRVLIAGGDAPSGVVGFVEPTVSAELYDPNTGAFTPTGSLTEAPRVDHTATLLRDGRVLIAGGYSQHPGYVGTPAMNGAEIYDPATGRFTPTGPMTVNRAQHQATLLADGRVLVIGGYTAAGGGYQLHSAEVYDPATGAFTLTGGLSVIREGTTAITLGTGRVLVAGGTTGCGCYGDSVWTSADLYDPLVGTFSPTGAMTTPRSGYTAALLSDGHVLLAGGSSSGSRLASAVLYDPITGTFSDTGSLPDTVGDATATALDDTTVLIAGGSDNYDYLAGAFIYVPSTGQFKPTGSMAAKRIGHTATKLANGHVLIAGGLGLASSELYIP